MSGEGEGEGCKEDESCGPEELLSVKGEVRFEDRRVGEKSEQGACVGEGEEAEPDRSGISGGAGFALGEPALEQGAGRGEEEEGKPDGSGEIPEDGGDGVVGCLEAGTQEPGENQGGERNGDSGDVDVALSFEIREAGKPVRVEVAEQEGGLEEDQAGEPDGGGAAEDREDLPGAKGFDEEEEEGREKGGGSVEEARGRHELVQKGYAKRARDGEYGIPRLLAPTSKPVRSE